MKAPLRPQHFKEAMEEAVKESARRGTWAVYELYCVVGQDGLQRCTGVTDPTLIQGANATMRPWRSVRSFESIASGDVYVGAPADIGWKDHYGVVRIGPITEWDFSNGYSYYQPLAVHGLFLEFAELADDGEVTLDMMLDWVERYGVLGTYTESPEDNKFWMSHKRGGYPDTFSRFAHEAKQANAVLRLYEAATAPEGPDVADIEKYVSNWWEWKLDLSDLSEVDRRYVAEFSSLRVQQYMGQGHITELKSAVLDTVTDIVRRKLKDNCYPELYQEGDALFPGLGFRSLLGAMYLQMAWLMSATGEVRRCRGPGCTRVITFEQPRPPSEDPGLRKNARGKYRTRKDKVFCSPRCKGNWYYHNRIKPHE